MQNIPIDRAAKIAALGDNSYFSNLTQNLRMLVGKVEELSFYQVTNRLARLISQLPEDQLVGETSHRITQD